MKTSVQGLGSVFTGVGIALLVIGALLVPQSFTWGQSGSQVCIPNDCNTDKCLTPPCQALVGCSRITNPDDCGACSCIPDGYGNCQCYK